MIKRQYKCISCNSHTHGIRVLRPRSAGLYMRQLGWLVAMVVKASASLSNWFAKVIINSLLTIVSSTNSVAVPAPPMMRN